MLRDPSGTLADRCRPSRQAGGSVNCRRRFALVFVCRDHNVTESSAERSWSEAWKRTGQHVRLRRLNGRAGSAFYCGARFPFSRAAKGTKRPHTHKLSIHLPANATNASVNFRVTISTKRYEIVFLVVPKVATGLNMMDLKILQAATVLAAPAITVQDPFP
jgi:hypothetical protein